MKEPILFDRFESDVSTTQPVLGDVGTPGASTTYASGKFGNGLYNTGLNKEVQFTTTPDQYIGNTGTIEFWFKPVGWSITNGQSSAGSHWLWDINQTGLRFFEMFHTTSGFFMRTYAGSHTGFGNTAYTPATMDIGDGVLAHYGYCWDSGGIDGGSDKMRFYFNGDLILNTTSAFTMPASTTKFWIGGQASNRDPAATVTADGVIDNLKVYDWCKIDFSDRENERGGLNDQQILL